MRWTGAAERKAIELEVQKGIEMAGEKGEMEEKSKKVEKEEKS
jgi:hypothetical protein